MSQQYYFSKFLVTSQVIYASKYSFALVNLKPILPGHVLVAPKRIVARLRDLSKEEIDDLFESVQVVQNVVEKAFGGTSSNIGIQDGPEAGQSVPHVHVHIIPRKKLDFENNDDVYVHLEKNEATMNSEFDSNSAIAKDGLPKASMNRIIPKDEDRAPRTMEEMVKEAKWLASLFKEDAHSC
ncbi:bis(5'-nucleosidyl)-tetraphosphatase [Schizosaccharomyces japonicus yFS275]|uniref:Bis(5'-nucleosidyl)-tetraphosphatase n=1 Tax=Schizosaccharomyces japonicus (strain yFS275 / FY16936) TaxID=402676 RepID=B6K641_SCHJY|nr:bis(5'-nucleosidyl)-tetraphosphatase [Schizosaccharomyces japonicus yFS275]EEB08995.1 bis(5'-nucleosidyl)-tetraphosphatase [Schizosaccharomyces japonicus yFS275]